MVRFKADCISRSLPNSLIPQVGYSLLEPNRPTSRIANFRDRIFEQTSGEPSEASHPAPPHSSMPYLDQQSTAIVSYHSFCRYQRTDLPMRHTPYHSWCKAQSYQRHTRWLRLAGRCLEMMSTRSSSALRHRDRFCRQTRCSSCSLPVCFYP